jgi:hypothetical protein
MSEYTSAPIHNKVDQPPFDWRAHLPVHPAAELFPLMPEAELQELSEDIKKNGLSAPIVLWIDGNNASLIDGRNRLDALALLGLLVFDESDKLAHLAFKKRQNDCQPITFAHEGVEPYALALSLNVHRRHLTAEQKRELVSKVLKAKPDASNRQIARQVKADDKTVASVRRELESNAEIPHKTDRVEASGHKARGRKPKPIQPTPATESAETSSETRKATTRCPCPMCDDDHGTLNVPPAPNGASTDALAKFKDAAATFWRGRQWAATKYAAAQRRRYQDGA